MMRVGEGVSVTRGVMVGRSCDGVSVGKGVTVGEAVGVAVGSSVGKKKAARC